MQKLAFQAASILMALTQLSCSRCESELSQFRRSGQTAGYIGLAKTRLLHLLIATALNFVRTAAWLTDIPLAHI
jgi:hypothetical protein